MVSMMPLNWTLERLMEKSEQEPMSGCWLWLGSADQDGYGYASVGHKTVKAHRVAWWIANETPPPSDLCVMHRCDNPGCVNPDHLRLGTNLENLADRDAKGRQSKGAAHWTKRADAKAGLSVRVRGGRNPMAVLTPEKVRAIRADFAVTGVQRPLCAKYGVSPMTINRIVRRMAWTHQTFGP